MEGCGIETVPTVERELGQPTRIDWHIEVFHVYVSMIK